MGPVPSAALLVIFNSPVLMVTPPVKVLVPVSVREPAPSLVSVPPELVRAVAQVTFWLLAHRSDAKLAQPSPLVLV